MLADLIRKNEEYQNISIEILDEDRDPDEIAKYQYELVPNFWVDGEKVLEGIPNKKKVQAVLDRAMAV